MAKLEEIARGAVVKGILPDGFATVVDVSWIGTVAIELTYKDSSGKLGNKLIYRDREAEIEVTLEIQATLPGGAPDKTVRDVTENCRTLKFESFGFEEA